MNNNRITKGPSIHVRVGVKNVELINKYIDLEYKMNSTVLTQRDIMDKICNKIRLKDLVARKTIEASRRGINDTCPIL